MNLTFNKNKPAEDGSQPPVDAVEDQDFDVPGESILVNDDQSIESIVTSEHEERVSFIDPAIKTGIFGKLGSLMGGFGKNKKVQELPEFSGKAKSSADDINGVSEIPESIIYDVTPVDPATLAQSERIMQFEDAQIVDMDVDGSVQSLQIEIEESQASVSARKAEIESEVGEKPVALPFIGHLPVKSQYIIGVGLLIGSLLAAGGMSGAGFVRASMFQQRTEIGTSLQMLSQRMLASTQYAITGNADAEVRLKESVVQVGSKFSALTAGIDGMSLDDNESLEKAHKIFTNEIVPQVGIVTGLAGSLAALQPTAQLLAASSYDVYVGAEQLLVLLQNHGAPDIHVAAANHIRVLAERLRRNGSTLLVSSDLSIEPLAQFASDFRSLQATVASLSKGDETIGLTAIIDPQLLVSVSAIEAHIAELGRVNEYLEKNAQQMVVARQNLEKLAASTELALKESESFSLDMRDQAAASYQMVYLSVIFVFAALMALALIGLINNRITRTEAWDSAFKNKSNEKDIIDFMVACLPLEMGDLTTRFNDSMEAMEGITGGIRNSVNEAVISLNEAVGTVKRTSEDVSGVVRQSVASATEMSVSNELQFKEINDVESRVAHLSSAIDEVTARTLEAAQFTESARTASMEGARVVSQTNEKMGMIRANMQDVLKSVKHLGETSHEIGEIVGTIEQITDRTQVLAVNASLEAAKAGAAGAGFQIIAGEVNRLAEQSAEALHTITALVQRVQGETGVTIKVVEESTNNVVAGAKLAEIANAQLEIISQLSESLSGVMGVIRSESETQTVNAKEVREAMERLGSLSRDFQSQVSMVVGGVQQIDASMGSLKNTVAIFTTEKEIEEIV